MASTAAKPKAAVARRAAAHHESFLSHRNHFYLKLATGLCLLAIAAYALTSPAPRHSGGDWLGYTLGTISVLLIIWLMLLGLRKRAITAGRWSLKGWTSAHVYLGLSLVVLATLHTGFQFGWNVHTLAYALMLVVIGSGAFGIYYYATVPRQMSDNRAEVGGSAMLEDIAALDAELRTAAQPLSDAEAVIVRRAIEAKAFPGSLRSRLARDHPRCPNLKALQAIRKMRAGKTGLEREDLTRVIGLLERRQAMLQRARAHIRYRTLLELWLYVHVPITFALVAALAAHIFAVFYFW